MITFTRLKKENAWGVRVTTDEAVKSGDTVTVTKRDGQTSQAILDRTVATFSDASLWTIQAPQQQAPAKDEDPVGPGVYEKDGEVYIVKQNREKTGCYAQRLVELRDSQGDRLTEGDDHVRYELEYQRGMIYRLTEDDRMTTDRGREFCLKYGKCIVCGRGLRVAESLERGIGPVCVKNFAGATS